MRLRLTLRSAATELPWWEVLRPGRLLCYTLLAEAEPELAGRLHAGGWGAHGMVPFGHGAPVFPGAARRRGRYAVGGTGIVELGSPLLAVVRAWAQAVGVRRLIDWGGAAMHVQAVELVDPPGFGSGVAVMRTTTPVVLKGSGRDADGVRTTRQAWLLPGEPEFEGYFAQGLRRRRRRSGSI